MLFGDKCSGISAHTTAIPVAKPVIVMISSAERYADEVGAAAVSQTMCCWFRVVSDFTNDINIDIVIASCSLDVATIVYYVVVVVVVFEFDILFVLFLLDVAIMMVIPGIVLVVIAVWLVALMMCGTIFVNSYEGTIEVSYFLWFAVMPCEVLFELISGRFEF